ncbi:MAG: NAD(P)/FAD-dependent oxidoreductase [Acidimicrobiales bacterium]
MGTRADVDVDVDVDVIVIGGSAAGLAAALQLGRVRRRVVVVDAGEPRNAPAEHLHGYLGHDGAAPAELLAAGRAEVARYGVELIGDRVLDLTGDAATGFTVTMASGLTRTARRILLATGLTDVLPAIDGLAERWGRQVIHCPYCHGWEVQDQRIVVIDTTGLGTHQALLFRQLSDRVRLVVHSGPGPDATQRAQLAAFDVEVIDGPVLAVGGGEPGHEPTLTMTLAGGASLEADAVVIAPRLQPNVAMAASLGVAVADDPSGIGSAVVTDAMGATSVAGVYAAGNVTQPMHQLLHAAAHGSQVAAAISFDLLHADLAARLHAAAAT